MRHASPLKEELADLCHRQWSGWTRYMFSKGALHDDGTLTLPAWAVERWTRQMNTLYADLPNHEKESDRKEANKFLVVIRQGPDQRPHSSNIWTTKEKPKVSFPDRTRDGEIEPMAMEDTR